MGLIKAAKSAITGTLGDQWKEAIRCEDMSNDVLMVKKTTPNGVISNKSTIIVAPGQCAVIYDNGRVIDATAEDGVYTFDSSSTPSFFAGQFGDVFKEMWQRFTYNGETAKQQAVFFFNTKDIMQNPFGTPNPIPFQDWSHAIPNQMTNTLTPLAVKIKCFGTYVFRITNPALFMEKVSGTAEIYKKDLLIEQIRSEVIAVFQNITNELGNSEHKVPVLEMPSQTDEIKEMMDARVYDEKIREKGIEITTFAVESVTLDEDSERKIEEYEHNSNAYMQQGRVLDVMGKAAENANGAANGFMGIGMMNMMSGGMGTGVIQNAFNPRENSSVQPEAPAQTAVEETPVEEAPAEETTTEEVVAKATWICPECGKENDIGSKFCSECGKAKPEEAKICPNCNQKNAEGNKFCNNCGTQL